MARVPLDVDAGLPAPWVKWRSTSSVPVLAVVTKPPMLGFAMSHSEKGMAMSASTSISPSSRSAETAKRHGLRHAVHVQQSGRVVARDDAGRQGSIRG